MIFPLEITIWVGGLSFSLLMWVALGLLALGATKLRIPQLHVRWTDVLLSAAFGIFTWFLFFIDKEDMVE